MIKFISEDRLLFIRFVLVNYHYPIFSYIVIKKPYCHFIYVIFNIKNYDSVNLPKRKVVMWKLPLIPRILHELNVCVEIKTGFFTENSLLKRFRYQFSMAQKCSNFARKKFSYVLKIIRPFYIQQNFKDKIFRLADIKL